MIKKESNIESGGHCQHRIYRSHFVLLLFFFSSFSSFSSISSFSSSFPLFPAILSSSFNRYLVSFCFFLSSHFFVFPLVVSSHFLLFLHFRGANRSIDRSLHDDESLLVLLRVMIYVPPADNAIYTCAREKDYNE